MDGAPNPDVAGVSVLVVDDEESIVRMVDMILKRMGYDVMATTDCTEALKALEERDFAVLLTDLRMSPIDGRKVLKHAAQVSPDTRVIFITAYASDEIKAEAADLGAAGYLTKPFRVDELLGAINAAVES